MGTLLAVLLTSSCAQLHAQMDGAERNVSDPATSATSPLETVSWANLNGMVSVLVRNTSDQVLQHAEAVITLENDRGVTVGTNAAEAAQQTTFEGRCCTATNLPPGATFGFYIYSGGADVSGVDIDYKNISFGSGGSAGGRELTVRPLALVDNRDGTVARAVVGVKDGPVDVAVIQAVIHDPQDRFLTVISGTWFCFAPRTPRTIRMQLYQAVPAGSTIASMSAVSVPSSDIAGDANSTRGCAPAQQREWLRSETRAGTPAGAR